LAAHTVQHLLDPCRVGSPALDASGVVATMREGPDRLHIGGVVVGARGHISAGVESGFDCEAVTGELAGVDLHQAKINRPALI